MRQSLVGGHAKVDGCEHVDVVRIGRLCGDQRPRHKPNNGRAMGGGAKSSPSEVAQLDRWHGRGEGGLSELRAAR